MPVGDEVIHAKVTSKGVTVEEIDLSQARPSTRTSESNQTWRCVSCAMLGAAAPLNRTTCIYMRAASMQVTRAIAEARKQPILLGNRKCAWPAQKVPMAMLARAAFRIDGER